VNHPGPCPRPSPVDPRPYAGPTDLVTAADVARWLRERADRDLRANCHPSAFVLHYAHADLHERLERERRQACRRGALACWRRWSSFVRKWRDVGAGGQLDAAALSTAPADKHAQWALGVSILDLELALAFRAAARQP